MINSMYCYFVAEEVPLTRLVLACLCDIFTALLPQVLLWDVKMKRRTKRSLNVIFALGLVTAALSIGRIATVTETTLTEDSTSESPSSKLFGANVEMYLGRIVPFYYITLFESKLGMILACGPALRQFVEYRRRTRSFLPSRWRQYPNEDFAKMRLRINMRDLFWYRHPPMVGNRVLEARRVLHLGNSAPPVPSNNATEAAQVTRSALDTLQERLRRAFGLTRMSVSISRALGMHNESLVRA